MSGRGQIRFRRSEVEETLAAAAARRERKARFARRFRQAVGVCLLGYVIVGGWGVYSGAPWYTERVRPWADRLAARLHAWSVAGGSDSVSPSLPSYSLVLQPLAWDDVSEVGVPAVVEEPVAELPPEPGPQTELPEPPKPGRVALIGVQQRPRPRDLDFTSVKPELRAYLRLQPVSLRDVEMDRINHVASVRDYLTRLAKYIPFENGGQGLRLVNGGRRTGNVVGANAKGVLLRLPGSRTRLTTVAWADLAFDQYLEFFDFYIGRRLDVDGEQSWRVGMEAGKTIPIPGRHDAAKDCLLAALLCDWYGHGAATRYFESARRYDPTLDIDRFALVPKARR